MKASRWLRRTAAGLLGVAASTAPHVLHGQGAAPKEVASNPRVMIVSIYNIAAGRHLDFLKYMAQLDAAAREAGLQGQQLYSHLDGDSWDYLLIRPAPSDAEQARLDSVMKTRGLRIGFAAGFKLREFVNSHTDTYTRGPWTAAELVAEAERK